MNDTDILDITKNALMLVLILSLPSLIVASFVGMLVSLLQTLTQIQEQTLSFAIKLIVVTLTLLLTARWAGSQILSFSIRLFDMFPILVP